MHIKHKLGGKGRKIVKVAEKIKERECWSWEFGWGETTETRDWENVSCDETQEVNFIFHSLTRKYNIILIYDRIRK